nr:orf45 [Trichoplusia ni single nucleopolyhedrovirus]
MSLSTSLGARFLEFEQVCIDLRYVTFMDDTTCDITTTGPVHDYIIFLNVKKAMFCNFNITTDMSLETLAEYIYDNVRVVIEERLLRKPLNMIECVQFNIADNNNSIFINLHAEARIIVAKKLFDNERYHQRITGYLDFEKRLDLNSKKNLLTDKERALLDREYEIKMLGST